MLEPAHAARPYVASLLANESGVFVAASDYMKALPLGLAPWVPGRYVVLGTDGFGLSEGRPELRDYFEVSAAWIAYAALVALARERAGDCAAAVDHADARAFAAECGLDLGKTDPSGYVTPATH
jgi:pyruvate dehydrogenase E1 component